jgi:hypothetical protein
MTPPVRQTTQRCHGECMVGLKLLGGLTNTIVRNKEVSHLLQKRSLFDLMVGPTHIKDILWGYLSLHDIHHSTRVDDESANLLQNPSRPGSSSWPAIQSMTHGHSCSNFIAICSSCARIKSPCRMSTLEKYVVRLLYWIRNNPPLAQYGCGSKERDPSSWKYMSK